MKVAEWEMGHNYEGPNFGQVSQPCYHIKWSWNHRGLRSGWLIKMRFAWRLFYETAWEIIEPLLLIQVCGPAPQDPFSLPICPPFPRRLVLEAVTPERSRQHFLKGKCWCPQHASRLLVGLFRYQPLFPSNQPPFPKSQDSLGLGLFCDVADGGPLLANDGTHILGGHQEPKGDIHLLLLGWGPRCHRWALAGLTPRAKAPSAPILRSLCYLLIRDVGDLQSMVLQLVAIQLHDGSGDRVRVYSHSNPCQSYQMLSWPKHSSKLQLGTH